MNEEINRGRGRNGMFLLHICVGPLVMPVAKKRDEEGSWFQEYALHPEVPRKQFLVQALERPDVPGVGIVIFLISCSFSLISG